MTVSDYLDWRGDLNFLQSPFNEIDQLILCLISYVDYEDLVPEEAAGAVTLAQISDALFRRHPESYYENQVSLTRLTPFLLKKAAQTARFASLRLFAYVNEIDDVNPTQFSAVSFLEPLFCISSSRVQSSLAPCFWSYSTRLRKRSSI